MSQLRDIIPPTLYRRLQKSWFRRHGWFGNFSSWEEAVKASSGYDTDDILEKVKKALLKVKNGQAAYERDSVLFDRMEFDWPIVASLNWVAAQHDGRLNVLDVGGSLGSTYYQNKNFLDYLKEVKWNIVEQERFVRTGKELFEDGQLRFYDSIDDCLKENTVNLVVLSSVLPYLEDPYGLLETLKEFNFMIIDKMPLIDSEADRITIQKVPKGIYNASYPAWFFSEKKFMSYISNHFNIVSDFTRDVNANLASRFKGFLLTKRELL